MISSIKKSATECSISFFLVSAVTTGSAGAATALKMIIVIIVLSLPFLYRFSSSIYKSSFAIQNIYNQQITTANYILDKNYKSVVVNDIGAVCYYNDIRILDVLGLGTNEVVNAIRKNEYNREYLAELADKKKCEAAFLYNGILDFELPKNWMLADSIKIENNVICWDDVVYVYRIEN